MSTLHFLNVKNGDCTLIQHISGHLSVIDVCNAKKVDELKKALEEVVSRKYAGTVQGNYNQKKNPVNPIEYIKSFNENSIFRFILTHPDMDHMDGIKDLFKEFSPTNFWDTDNNEEKEFDEESPYNPDDWEFYKSLRDSNSDSDPKRLAMYDGAKGKYYNQNEQGQSGGDGLYILSPTQEIIKNANESNDYNDSSYVILYKAGGGKILIPGDAQEKTWEHLMENHEDDIKNCTILLAPHHGRKLDSYDFLNTVNPTVTFFGNASSKHLAYDAWSSRKLPIITNNQAGCIVVDVSSNPMKLFVTNETFAEKVNEDTYYSNIYNAYYCCDL